MKFLEINSQVKISLTVAVVDREAEINKKVRKHHFPLVFDLIF
jgi:hypothetical protein